MNGIILPEIISVGIYNAGAVTKNKTVTKSRKTTLFEIELPIGEGGMTYIDNTSHEISESTVICAKPGQLRHTRLPFKCYYIHMIVNEGRLFDILSSLPNYIALAETEEIKGIFSSLCSLYDIKSNEEQLLIHSHVLRLIHLLNQYTLPYKIKHVPRRNNNEFITKTVEYIGANLTADLSLEALSKSVGFSPVYFHKLFKASTGKTLRDYVEEQRLKRSVDLLLSTDLTLTQIAYACGFSSQSYFSYAFKKKMKRSPREYARHIHLKYEITR